MSSIFYKNAIRGQEKEIPLTFLLVEVLDVMKESLGSMEARQALFMALDSVGMIPEEGVSEAQLESLLTRVYSLATKEASVGAPSNRGKAASSKRTFASQYLKFYEKLSIADKCLVAAGHDFEVARRLYCVYDKEVSEEIIQGRFNLDFEKMQVQYEGVVFGMGGSFGSKSSIPDGEVIDHAPAPDSPDYLSAAQDFVNMQHSFRSKGR